MKINIIRKPTVSLAEVETIVAMRETAKAIKKRLETLQDIIKIHEQDIISKLNSGAGLLPCEYVLSIRETEKRFPAWKEHFIENCGKALADEILESTEARVYRDLLIKVAA